MESHRDLSLRLDDAMDMVGASESMRRLHRHAATTQEILCTMFRSLTRGDKKFFYHCGSSYEGTVTPGTASDIDIINCILVPSVVTHRLMAGSGLRLLVFRDDWTFPGYVKLQGLLDGQPVTADHRGAPMGFSFDRRGRACLKHIAGDNMHGPASMHIKDGIHITDNVFALKCNGIPPWAAEWIRRRRSHDWPSEQQLDRMRVMACMVVQAGFYNSPEKDIEWRLSFSLQERLLMESLNIYQHKVYIILKLIKNNILEHRDESLSSYHCKTCVLYMAELTPTRMWTRDNLIDCLIECLRLMLKWLRNRFCPSYFIKEQNLFEKEGFERLIEPLQRSIELILQSGHQFLYMLQSDHIGDILRSGDCRLYRQVSYVRVNYYIFRIRLRIIEGIAFIYNGILTASGRHQDVLPFLTTQLENIQSQDIVSIRYNHTPEETKAALRPTELWLHLQIGLEFACRAVTCSIRSDGRELMKKVDFHFRQARNTDFANVQLAQASILMRFGKFEECFLLLQKMEAKWSFRMISMCGFREGASKVPGAQQLHDYYPPMRDISVTKLLRNYVAMCVVFLPSQSELVPLPLQYEMFRSVGTPPGSRIEEKDAWFDWAVVDAKVYIYFMQYLVCTRLDREPHKQIAIDNLSSLIQHARDRDLHHKETAYNLLGWIYLQEHRTVDAVWCFIQSWQIRPHHNAAKFHVLNIYQARYTYMNTAM